MKNLNNTFNVPPAEIVCEQDFIVLYRGLDKELCRAVTDLFDLDQNKWQGKIGRTEDSFYTDYTKISWDLEIRDEGVWQDIFQKIHPQIEACMNHYLSRSPILQSFDLQRTGYKIQMYPKNKGRFLWHADSLGKNVENRVVAMIVYLNDVETGGETEFFHQGIKIPPKAGHIMLFPAGWNYMHCGHVPVSGDKYIISTFIKVKH